MAPWALRDTRTTPARPRTILFMWMTRLLLFKLMFLSGIVKIASGDPTWRDATALGYHYETQPLPTPLAWYVNQMPPWFDALSTYLMFVVELIVPLFMFGGLRARIFAAIATVGLQIIILSTGNYTFFNLLTMLLCVSLVDNSRLPRFQRGLKGYPWGPAIVAISIFIISVESVVDEFTGGMAISAPANQILSLVGPFRAVNNYGLFRVMTTTRDEITIEGSYDGVNWKPYVFPFKPGPLDRAPPMVAPHQPRLDWQMWFASLGTVRNNMWFLGLAQRLLEGSPPVLELLASNPFPDKPPTYIRATIAPYHFTNFDEFGRTKHWWKAGDASVYLPPARL
jgi:lipase maturation factor 1